VNASVLGRRVSAQSAKVDFLFLDLFEKKATVLFFCFEPDRDFCLLLQQSKRVTTKVKFQTWGFLHISLHITIWMERYQFHDMSRNARLDRGTFDPKRERTGSCSEREDVARSEYGIRDF